MRIFVTGDVHGDIDYEKIKIFRKTMRDELSSDDCLIVCGDFGITWDRPFMRYMLNNVYSDFPCKILFTDGNHENFDILYEFPAEEWNGGHIRKISDRIFHLCRGEVFNLDGLNIFTMGGARSTDRGYGEHGSKGDAYWWVQELPSDEEKQNALTNLSRVNYNVDYILTHDAPSSIVSALFNYSRRFDDTFNRFLEEIYQRTEFKKWYFGHHHRNQSFDKFECLYDSITEIKH